MTRRAAAWVRARAWGCALALPVLLASPARAAAPAHATPPESARLDSVMAVFAHQGFMGTVLVARGSHFLLDRGYGLADRERRAANAPDTRATWCSER